jgi:protein TonB
MFEGFAQGSDSGSRRRVTLSTIASLALYAGAAGALAAAAANAPPPAELVKKVQVTFRPPPPPAAVEPPPPRRAPAPPVPKKMKTIEVAGLPPPPPLVAPKEIPLEAPPEAEPTDAPIAVAPASEFSGYGGAGAGSGSSTRRAAPVHLPEAATPPVAASSNVPPVYPEAARQRGQEGQVVLKIVIDEDGRVARVEVLRGDEPFASVAASAVKRWKYQPATLDGNPIAIFRIVKVPFRIN